MRAFSIIVFWFIVGNFCTLAVKNPLNIAPLNRCSLKENSAFDIFTTFSMCVSTSISESPVYTDYSKIQLMLAGRCFATSFESARRYGFCRQSSFTVNLPGFAWLAWGPLSDNQAGTEIVDAVMQAFLTEPICLIRVLWPEIWTEYKVKAKEFNVDIGSTRMEMPKLLEVFFANPQKWANWLNSLSMRIMQRFNIEECKKQDKEMAEATEECIVALQPSSDWFVDHLSMLTSCKSQLGQNCAAVIDRIGDAFCGFMNALKTKANKSLEFLNNFSIFINYANLLPSKYITNICVSLLKNLFVTKNHDWFELIEKARAKCLPDKWPLFEFVHYICFLTVQDVDKINDDFVMNIKIIANILIDEITIVVSGPNNFCQRR